MINKLQHAQVSDEEKVTKKSKKGKATFVDTYAIVKKSFWTELYWKMLMQKEKVL